MALSDVDLRIIWELEGPCPAKMSGSDVEGPGTEDTGDWLCSSDEPEEETADSEGQLSTESTIWPGM